MKVRQCTVLMLFCFTTAIAEDTAPEQCAEMQIYGLLDFWVGDWIVFSGEEKVGENKIEKILGGCAVMEHWQGVGGREGKSLFFVDTNGTWKQVWVTEWAANPGGVKEKAQVLTSANEAVRFQGQLRHPDVGTYLDRTTLTRVEEGKVHQLIETSTDSGETWKTTFDATYVQADFH